jgi:hypothetical protein
MTQAAIASLEIAGIDNLILLPLELKFNSMKVTEFTDSREGKILFSQKINNRRQNFKKNANYSWRFLSTFTSNYFFIYSEFVGFNVKFQTPNQIDGANSYDFLSGKHSARMFRAFRSLGSLWEPRRIYSK